MRVLTKTFLIIFVGFSSRVLFSCCNCGEPPIDETFTLDDMTLSTLDNSVVSAGPISNEFFGIAIDFETTRKKVSGIVNSFFHPSECL